MTSRTYLLFFVVLASESLAQTVNLLPIKTTRHIKDSVVEVIFYEKRASLWTQNASYRNVYSYDKNGLLHVATVSNQDYLVKYKNGRIISAMKYNGKKRQTKLVYHYNEKGQTNKIVVFNYINRTKQLWGNEYMEYDSFNRLISSSYIIQNDLSLHPGYNHSATYEYDGSGKLISEDWGYQHKTHHYKEGKLEYTYIVNNEFNKTKEYKQQYQIVVTQ